MKALHEEGRASCSASPTKLARVEVFSAHLIGIDPYYYEDYFGLILLESSDLYAIFESSCLEPPLISPEGCITLTGPERSIPVEDEIVIYPLIFNVGVAYMNKEASILWSESDGFNKCNCKKIKLLFGKVLQMHFAVYNDAVEAHLDVCLVGKEWGDADEPILICGTVSCSNSFISDSGAKSILFHKDCGDDVRLKPNKSIALPLSRRMVVVPRGSALHVDVCLAIGSEPEDASIARNMVKFTAQSNIEECIVIVPNCGKVSVKVTWMECEDHV